jgi:hypothetical protein
LLFDVTILQQINGNPPQMLRELRRRTNAAGPELGESDWRIWRERQALQVAAGDAERL